MKILSSIFRSLLALLVVVSCLPIFVVIFLHFFIVGFIAEEKKEMTIKDMREKQMLKALKHFRTVEDAAKALGISARTLYLFKLTLN